MKRCFINSIDLLDIFFSNAKDVSKLTGDRKNLFIETIISSLASSRYGLSYYISTIRIFQTLITSIDDIEYFIKCHGFTVLSCLLHDVKEPIVISQPLQPWTSLLAFLFWPGVSLLAFLF